MTSTALLLMSQVSRCDSNNLVRSSPQFVQTNFKKFYSILNPLDLFESLREWSPAWLNIFFVRVSWPLKKKANQASKMPNPGATFLQSQSGASQRSNHSIDRFPFPTFPPKVIAHPANRRKQETAAAAQLQKQQAANHTSSRNLYLL